MFSKSKDEFFYSGEMVKLLQNRTDFADGISSLTNIQRQFFDSFVGQTFKVLIQYNIHLNIQIIDHVFQSDITISFIFFIHFFHPFIY